MDGKLRAASGIASQTDALAKLEAEARPTGQVVVGRVFWVTFLSRHKKVTRASKRATKSYGWHGSDKDKKTKSWIPASAGMTT